MNILFLQKRGKKMGFKKYVKPLIASLIIIGLLTFAMAMAMTGLIPGPYNYVPGGPNTPTGIHILWVFIWYVISPIIGVLVFGYLLGPLFLFIHKKIIGRTMEYGIQDKPKPDEFKGKYRAFFPALMAINFAFMLIAVSSLLNLLLAPEWVEYTIDTSTEAEAASVIKMVALMGMVCVTIGVAMALFAPVWFLLDAGIVYTNQEKVKDSNTPTEIRSVGGWYLYLLKGYAGIGVIITYYLYIVEGLSAQTEGPGIIFVPALPIMLIIFSMPAVVLFDMTHNHRRKYMLYWAKKFGIVNNVDVSFKVIE